jgi:hypothetical protein
MCLTSQILGSSVGSTRSSLAVGVLISTSDSAVNSSLGCDCNIDKFCSYRKCSSVSSQRDDTCLLNLDIQERMFICKNMYLLKIKRDNCTSQKY